MSSLTSTDRFIPLGNPPYEADNILWDAIEEGPVDRSALVDRHKLGRRVLKVGLIALSLGANGSYFPIIFRAGPVYAVGNSLSFFALDYWAVTGTLEGVLGSRGEREISLISRNSKGRIYQVALTTGAIGLSLLAVAPLAIPVWDYDGAYRIPGMLAIFLGGSILPLRSIQLSLNKTIQGMKCVLGETGRKIEAVRSEMISLVDEWGQGFELMEMAEKLEVIRSLSAIRDMDEDERVGKYLSVVLAGAGSPVPVESTCRKVVVLAGKAAAHLPGVIVAASLETALALYTYGKAQEYITDNEIGAGFCAAVTVGSGIYLNGKSIVSTTHRFASALFSGLCCRSSKGIAEQLRPKLSICLKLIGLTLNLGTVGSSLVIFGDFFKDRPIEKEFFVITTCSAYFILTATATLDLVDSAVKALILRGDDADERQVIHLCQEFDQLKRLLEESSLLDFASFVLKCPREVKAGLLNRVGLLSAELNAHVARLEEAMP